MAAKKTPAPEKAPRRLFRPDQCRHRDADGKPDCTAKKIRPAAATCTRHAAEWMATHGRAPRPKVAKAAPAKVVRLRTPAPRTTRPVARVAALVAVEPTVEKVR